MASKKSKVLAIAFCAAVMSGIYVNPVLAAEIPVKNDGSVTIGCEDFDDAKVTITNIASQKDLAQETADRETKDAEHDSAIKNETLEREAADNKIKADLQADINAKEEKSKDRDSQLQANIDAEAEAREKADADLQDRIDDHTNQISSIGKELNDLKESDKAQNGTLAGHQEQLDDHSQQLDTVRGEISEEHRVNGEQNNRLDAHDISIKNHEAVMGVTDKTGLESAYEGATYIDKNDTMVEADRKLDAAISDVNSRVDGIENRVDGLEGRIDKVGAMSAAIANLRTMGYDPAAPTEVAVGVGQYRDETGMALGLFHYPNRDFMLSLSVSTSGDEYMGGIGATWKFGRKSPEKVAEIKKAQAEADARRAEEQKLAKAEEMKKAAKEAKVQAQMERHAKMLAEQEAQAEA